MSIPLPHPARRRQTRRPLRSQSTQTGKTTILTYGINGYGQDEATGQPQYSYFTNEHRQSLHLLAVLGQDLTGCAMQGYTDGSCDRGRSWIRSKEP